MKEEALHQKLIDTYGIRKHRLPEWLASSITSYQNLYEAYKAQWKQQHDFIDYKNLTDEQVERAGVFLDKKRQFREGKKSFNQMLWATQFVGKGREGDKFILYMDDSRGYPVPEYIYHALLSVRPSSNKDGTDYGAMLHRADGQITQGLLDFLRNNQKELDYYLSDTGTPPADSQSAPLKLKTLLYESLERLALDIIALPICRQYQTKFKEGKAYQISCIAKSSEASYFDLVELKFDPKNLTIHKTRSYTFYIQDNIVEPLLGVYYDEFGKVKQDLEVVQVMGSKAKDQKAEIELLKALERLLTYLVKERIPFTHFPKPMELLLSQLTILKA